MQPETYSARIAKINTPVCCECGKRLQSGLQSNVCGDCLEKILKDNRELELMEAEMD